VTQHPAASTYADLRLCARFCDVINNLNGPERDEAIDAVVRALLGSPRGAYLRAHPTAGEWELSVEIVDDARPYGWLAVAGRAGGYDANDMARLQELAYLAACLFGARKTWRDDALRDAEDKLLHQAQVIDQIRDSVITMDPFGFITAWNKGAERLFGYSASEAIGRSILFLYVDEGNANDLSPLLLDEFLGAGGHDIEVRRRKKSGEVFWANLSLSRTKDAGGHIIGLTGFVTDITERKQAEERIHHLAYFDALTGLPNRTLLCKLTDQALSKADRAAENVALLFIDLNRFKPINDTLGHEIGNRLLQEVGRRLRETIRDEDVVARLGADEFVVALYDITRRDNAGVVAQKLLAAFEAPVLIDAHELRIALSIGISVFPQDGNDTETLLRLADIAMYRTKQAGQEGFGFYSQDMNRRAYEALKIESGLRRALEENQLLLYYQPKVRISDSAITGVEALVRWQHPHEGLLLPNEFIRVAEETGLIVRLGAWVLEAACRQARTWKEAGLPVMRVAVNISAREFTPALPGRVRDILVRHGLTPQWLELEITESMLMHSSDRAVAMMDELTAMGVSLSLDDFGTGFSSLSYLKRFPIETLKIDRSFIHGIPDDINDIAIAGAITGMARQMRRRVIAEGVETPAQLQFLAQIGCDEIQGYLFSPPLIATEMTALLNAGRQLPR
jgi:diguanylate cyclase (GGDEF)-like protein/PAS domain S-box-containing protein